MSDKRTSVSPVLARRANPGHPGFSFVAFVICATLALACGKNGGSVGARSELLTNEEYIRALLDTARLGDAMQAFSYVFSRLEEDVAVYPTENYYYFSFSRNGRQFKGNIGLLSGVVDSGRVNFACEEVRPITDTRPEKILLHIEPGPREGLTVTRRDTFDYDLSFAGKTVRFHLSNPGVRQPVRARLDTNEVYVGPSYDESGLEFHLVYDSLGRHLFWVLNEDRFVPETFLEYAEGIVIGHRTEFAFLKDSAYNRKILFGVKKENVDQNNWFDGPFDQMPDTYIRTGQVKLQYYLERSFPEYVGGIDRFGHIAAESGTRIAVSSYLIYGAREELLKVYYASRNSSAGHAQFVKHLTTVRYLSSL